MIIKNASVFTEESCFFEQDIFVEGDRIVSRIEELSETAKEEVIDGSGCYLIPGLTDIHFHGCMGRDFCDGSEEAIDTIAAYEASVGVTTIVPATMTMKEEVLGAVCEAADRYRKAQEAGQKKGKAILVGIHMEGPFISREKMGAQNPEYIKEPENALYEMMQKKSGGIIKIVDIAPEIAGAIAFIKDKKEEAILSLSHTMADYTTAMEAFAAGALHVTHFYNAMTPFSHREPGIIGAAADAGANVELVCDGVHVHPSAVRAAFRLIGKDKVILISDSMRAAGLKDGTYSLGGQSVMVQQNHAVLENGTIAGSVVHLMDCMRNAVKYMQIPLETAIQCAAVNSAKSVGIYDEYGSITPGKKANLVLLQKEDLSLHKVILSGEIVKNVKNQ